MAFARRRRRKILWPLAAAVPLALLLGRERERIGLPRPVSTAVVASAPLAVMAAAPRSRRRDVATWIAQMWAYKIAFEVPYDDPEKLRARLLIDPAIAGDARLGGGMPFPERLQRALRRPPELTRLDYALSLFYATWEAEPHAVLGWILWRRPERFARAALRLAATFDSTLIGYWTVPSAPPWWASEREGRMGGAVHRVSVEAMRGLRGKPRPAPDAHARDANPWAAMPSDHFGSAAMAALLLAEQHPAAGAAGTAYALALGFALVYLGEHYVVDLAAGLILAAAVAGIERATR